jgi:hypothetical protein
MANETAATYVPLGREGTGYATILQNTILPSLQNEQRRADRLYQMEELAKQAAAKAAAKQAEEDAKFSLPYVKAGPAGYYQPEVDRLRTKLLQDAKQKFVGNRYTKGEQIDEMNNVQGTLDAVVNEGAFQSQKLKDLIPDLQKSGFVGANERSLAQYMNTQYGKPNFFNTDHTTGYVSFLKTQPKQNVSPREIGQAMSKQFQPVRRSVQNNKRETETFEYSPMFEAEEYVDPLLNATVIKAEKPNIPELEKVLKGNPAMLEAAGAWVENEAKDYMDADKTLTADIAREKALGQFWSQATTGLSKTAYDYNRPPVVRPSGAGKKAEAMVEEAGPVDVQFTNVPDYDPSVAPKNDNNQPKSYVNWSDDDKKAFIQQGKLHLGQSKTKYFEKPQTAGANKHVILLSNNKDAEEEGLVERNKKGGGYTLKTSFEYKAATPVKVRVFKQDTNFPINGPTKYTVPALTPVDDDVFDNMSVADRQRYITDASGYLISPEGGVPEYTPEGVPKYGQSKVASTQIIVLDDSAEDIRAAIARNSKKGTAPKQKPFTFKNN